METILHFYIVSLRGGIEHKSSSPSSPQSFQRFYGEGPFGVASSEPNERGIFCKTEGLLHLHFQKVQIQYVLGFRRSGQLFQVIGYGCSGWPSLHWNWNHDYECKFSGILKPIQVLLTLIEDYESKTYLIATRTIHIFFYKITVFKSELQLS